jgi:hypothetical protein
MTQSVEHSGQEEWWPVASNRECLAARPCVLGRVLSRGGLQDVHTDDLSPGLTVRVRLAILYAPDSLSLRLRR